MSNFKVLRQAAGSSLPTSTNTTMWKFGPHASVNRPLQPQVLVKQFGMHRRNRPRCHCTSETPAKFPFQGSVRLPSNNDLTVFFSLVGGPQNLPSSARWYSPTWRIGPPESPSIHPSSSSKASTATDSPMSEQLRSLMRLLAHSVVVCTSIEPGAPGRGAVPRAMTMSSFTSLTLYPTPLVSFNIATPSRTLSAVQASRHFNVHVLRSGVEGARVADWFTRGNADGHRVFEGLTSKGAFRSGEDGPVCRVEMEPGAAPVLKGAGVLYSLRCQVLDDAPHNGLIPVRDHVIVVGEVLGILDASDGGEGQEDAFGLVYADRRYRQLGAVVVKD